MALDWSFTGQQGAQSRWPMFDLIHSVDSRKLR